MEAVAPVAPMDKAIPMLPEREKAPLRRLDPADLNFHAPWLLDRMAAVFNYLDSRQRYGWLNSMIFSPDYMLLFQENAVGCAQLNRAMSLEPVPVVQERFLFVRDPRDKEQVNDALGMYDEFMRFGKLHNATTFVLYEKSDIPIELVKKHLGRVFDRQISYVKIV